MSLVYFDGFQDVQVAGKPEWAGSVFNYATGRDGSVNGAAGAGAARFLPFTLGNPTMIMGFGWQTGGALPGSTGIVLTWSNGSTPTNLMHMGITADGRLEFRRGNNFSAGIPIGITSGHDPLGINQWRHIQIKYVAHVSAGTLVVRIDDAVVLNVTGVQTAPSTLTPDRWYHNGGGNFGGNQWLVDDFWLCDGVDATATQGRPNNDFLGDLKITTLIPTANGDLSAWTKSTGTNAAALVDEVPPNTTDYIFSSVSAQRELMVLPDLPVTAGVVYGARVNMYALKTDAGASSVKPLLKEGGGTITPQTARPLSTTVGAIAGEFLFTKPSAPTTPWTAADINALQIGAELA